MCLGKMRRKYTALYFLLLSVLSFANAFKFLLVLPTAARSHYSVGSAIANGLAKSGHQVTIISAFPLMKPIANITDVAAMQVLNVMSGNMKRLLDNINQPITKQMFNFNKMGWRITESLLEEPQVQVLLKSNQKFDAVICEIFLNEAHFGLAEHFNAPLIGFSTFGATPWNTELVGSPSPPSYVPHALLKFSDRMSMLERVANLAFYSFEYLNFNFFYIPEQEKIFKKYFPNNKQSLQETRVNTALVLLNQHVSLSFPRPYSPNMIEVGGMHINDIRKPLPGDIKQFIEGAEHGVIYFSMGSNLKSKDLPLEKLGSILNAFRNIKQRVLWKFEDSNLSNKPENVFISDWFPQDDILAHEKVLAFITHGGLLSTTESIYHGKPFIGIPIFGDQFLNMARAELNGYGITVHYDKLTTERLNNAIKHIMGNSKYTQLVQEMSARFRDQKELPLERAIYWIEHVTRHKGAKYLRSASQDLNFIQYHNLDAIFILYGGIFFVLYIIFVTLKFFISAICNIFVIKSQSKNTSNKAKIN